MVAEHEDGGRQGGCEAHRCSRGHVGQTQQGAWGRRSVFVSYVVVTTAGITPLRPNLFYNSHVNNTNVGNQIYYLVSPVPVRWALKLYIISWFSQNLSNLFCVQNEDFLLLCLHLSVLNCNEFPPLLLLLDRGRVGTVLGSALFVDILYVLIIFPRCRLKTKVDSVSCLNHSSYATFLY